MAISSITDLGLVPADIDAWRALIAAQKRYNLVARQKNDFQLTVGTNPVKIPWTLGHNLSLFIPSIAVWMGGNNSVSVGRSTPIAAGATVIFGPEEGDSPTYLIAASASVDVRCFELLP